MTGRTTDGAPETGRLSCLWGSVVYGIAALGTLLIVGLMLLINADIVARSGFGGSLPLVSELGALLVVLIVALQFAAAVRADRLARTMAFLAPLEETRLRAAALRRALHDLTGAAVVGATAWSSIAVLSKDGGSGEFIGTTGLGTMPTWPFRALILLGLTVAAIEFLRRATAALRGAAR